MLQSIWDDVRREFSFGNMINKIIIVNVAVYLVVNIFWVIVQLANGIPSTPPRFYREAINFISISDSPWHMITHPWALITHMFLHEGFFHLLFNMLVLFWFGRIFGDLLGDRRVLPLYLTGGLAGFLAYFLAFNVTDLGSGSSFALGASGAVACILTAAGTFAPEYGIRLMFFGTVRLKWIVFFTVMVQIIGLGSLYNIGGTIDHLGGIVFGFLYVFYLRRGTDLTQPTVRSLAWLEDTWQSWQKPSKDHTQRSGPRAVYRREKTARKTAHGSSGSFTTNNEKKSTDAPASGRSHQEELDAILDKIKDKGYNSLTKEEKDFLFRASNQ